MNRFLRLILGLCLLATAALPGAIAPVAAANPTSTSKVLIASDATAARGEAQSLGTLVADYGSFAVWKLPTPTANRLAAQAGVSVDPQFDTLYMRSGAFNPLTDAAPVTNDLQQARTTAGQLWMVQFVGPVKDEWLKELDAAGARPVIFIPNNAYVVWADGAAVDRLSALATRGTSVQWAGPYHTGYRINPVLNSLDAKEMINATIQFYTPANAAASVDALINEGYSVVRSPSRVLDFTNVTLEMPVAKALELARQPNVFNVERWNAPTKLDERQGQILAGNITTVGGKTVPTGPGYLAWLQSMGMSTNPADYPIVDVVDDGIDIGNASNVQHADFYQLGLKTNADRVAYIGNCTINDPSGNAGGGHGNLNASIVVGYNDKTGAPYEDGASDGVPAGSNYGLGISPFGRVAGTKIFQYTNPNVSPYDIAGCGNTDEGVVQASYAAGADMTSNSWGCGSCGPDYDTSSQAYDALTLDASATTAGVQPMLHVFSAGNDGPGASTLGTPGTAKNVLTVGATENVRDNGVLDGCNLGTADNADEIASFSSRGPTLDQRIKPDIMAPGTHIMGAASQDPDFDGSGICGGQGDKYYPAGQTLYTWSSGTSHSAPAIAGGASLAYAKYMQLFGIKPSPAMLKAYLINSTRYLAPIGGNLPTNNQGYGDLNLGLALDTTLKLFRDEPQTFGATGETYTLNGEITDSSKPFHVTLAWSDAPGATTGAAYINNLNLAVTVNGQTYLGNVFTKGGSVTGGSADARNNVESVMLPAGVSGAFQVTVTAANIAADGAVGNADTTDQSFGLALYNARPGPMGTLSGKVKHANNTPIAGARVIADTGNQALSKADGTYSLLLVPGTYTVTATLDNYNDSDVVSGIVITQDVTTTQDFILEGGAITGVVMDTFTPAQPIAGATVGNGIITTTTAPDGSYTLAQVPTGANTVTATAPNYLPDSATVSVSDAMTATANLELSAGGVEGTVTNQDTGAPISGVRVEIGPSATTTNSAGMFALRLPPATYTVTATKPGLGTYTGIVTIVDGVTTTLNITLMAVLDVAPSTLTKTAELGSPPVTDTSALVLTNNTTQPITVTVEEAGSDGDLVLIVQRGTTPSNSGNAALANYRALGYNPTLIANTVFEGMTLAQLQQYDMVVYVNAPSVSTSAPTTPSIDKLIEYLDAGGRLLLMDNDVGYYAKNTTFYTTYLDSTYGGDKPPATPYTLTGEDIMAGLTVPSVDPFPDYYTPGSSSTVIFRYSDNTVGGSRITRNNYKVVYIAMDINSMGTSAIGELIETQVVRRASTWLMGRPNNGIRWLDEDPKVVSVPVSGTASIDIGWFANKVTQPGVYTGALKLTYSQTPELFETVPVTFNVTPGANQIALTGVVSGTELCAMDLMPLAGATVTITNSTGYNASTTTNAAGEYSWFLDGPGEYTVTISAAGYATQVFTVNLTGDDTLDATLYQDQACLEATSMLSVTQAPDTVTTQTLTISNTGAVSLTWSLEEGMEDGRPTAPAATTEMPRRPVSQLVQPLQVTTPFTDGIQDGSFEASNPATLTNPFWNQGSTNFGTVICNAAICGTNEVPRTGNFMVWFGGIRATTPTENGFIEQTTTIPTSARSLNFWLKMQSTTNRPGDSMSIKIDNTTVFTVTNPERANYAAYTEVSVPITQFADGGSHTIRFESLVQIGGNTNFVVDDVSLMNAPVSCGGDAMPWLSVSPASGVVGPYSSSHVDVVFDSTGMSEGTYSGFLCLATNDPQGENRLIPVSLTVTDVAPTSFKLFLPLVIK